MRIFSTSLAVALLLGYGAATARADSLQTFSMDSTTVAGTTKTLSGSTLTVKLDDLSVAGVSFDATLTVVGSSTLTRTSSGLGVSGNTSALLNDSETLTFSMLVDDVSGGTAAFDGFTALDFTFFTVSGETAVFSLDGDLTTECDNFLTHTALSDPDIAATAPAAFTLFGQNGTDADGGTVTTSFRVDSIQGTFSTIAAVPEPGTLGLLGMACLLVGVRELRRRRGSA